MQQVSILMLPISDNGKKLFKNVKHLTTWGKVLLFNYEFKIRRVAFFNRFFTTGIMGWTSGFPEIRETRCADVFEMTCRYLVTPLCRNKYTNEPPHDKTNKMVCAPSKDSDQPGHLPGLIRVFAVRVKKVQVLSYLLSAQQRLWSDWVSDWVDAQADQSLRWAHRSFCWFCHETAQTVKVVSAVTGRHG